MRELSTRPRIVRFLAALGSEARAEGRVYVTGGATAVLIGWRETTIDVDIKLVPEEGAVLRAIQGLKESLQINVELASPDDFIPVASGWQDRSPFIERHGRLSCHHFEFAAQALSKLERGHQQDLEDVDQMIGRGLVTPRELVDYLDRVESQFYRYPAIDLLSLRAVVENLTNDLRGGGPWTP